MENKLTEFIKISNNIQRKIKVSLSKLNLTYTQFQILLSIDNLTNLNKHITQKLLSDETNIDVMTISTTLKCLERKSLIQINKNKKDARANEISNTLIGNSILEESKEIIKILNKELFIKTNQDIKNLLKILNM